MPTHGLPRRASRRRKRRSPPWLVIGVVLVLLSLVQVGRAWHEMRGDAPAPVGPIWLAQAVEIMMTATDQVVAAAVHGTETIVVVAGPTWHWLGGATADGVDWAAGQFQVAWDQVAGRRWTRGPAAAGPGQTNVCP